MNIWYIVTFKIYNIHTILDINNRRKIHSDLQNGGQDATIPQKYALSCDVIYTSTLIIIDILYFKSWQYSGQSQECAVYSSTSFSNNVNNIEHVCYFSIYHVMKVPWHIEKYHASTFIIDHGTLWIYHVLCLFTMVYSQCTKIMVRFQNFND